MCVIVEASIGPVMKWAKENGLEGKSEKEVVASDVFKKELIRQSRWSAFSQDLW